MILGMAAIMLACPAIGQGTGKGLGPYRHDRWSSYEGAPTATNQIAQTDDGWIWLAASKGLFRFDGKSFERIAGPAGSPMENAPATSLLVARSGDLWVGYGQNGGIAVFRKGRLHSVAMPDPPRAVMSMAQTPDGAIWAMSDPASYPRSRLQRWANGRWERHADTSRGLPDGAPSQLCVTGDGTLWALLGYIHGNRLVALKPGAPRFDAAIQRTDGIQCHVDRRGRLWIGGRSVIRSIASGDGTVAAPATTSLKAPPDELADIAFDAAGNLWATTTGGKGIYVLSGASPSRSVTGPHVRRFTSADGLSSDVNKALFVDRDDNVWVGTEEGVDRFRTSVALQETMLPGDSSFGYGLTSNQGKIFVGSRQGLFEMSPGRALKRFSEENWGQCPARDGGIWLLFPTRIVHLGENGQTSFRRPMQWILTSECVEDRAGRLWVADVRGALFWHDRAGWHTPARALPKVLNWDLVLNASGDLAYVTEGGLVQLIGSTAITTSLLRYDPGMISNISAGRRDLFISGSNGLLRIRGNRIARLDGRRFPWVAGLRTIVQTSRGETWLMESNSISRVSTSDLDRAFADPKAPLDRVLLDARDGVRPTQDVNFRGPQATVDGAGRIWQLSRFGISYIDPARLASRRKPPPVFIRALQFGDTIFRDPAALTLPPGTSSIELGYTALNFAFPERVRFRYRLEGVDPAWVDPGDRRVASYANLGPGRYRFEVIASDDQKMWSAPARLDIRIRPTFVQSWPFKLLVALAVLALLWLAYAMRLRTVAARIRSRMSERIAERERIARELHDTLLQSVQALTLRFQLAAEDLPPNEPSRAALETAIDRADAVIAEGRDRVRDLRPVGSDATAEQLVHEIVARQGFGPEVVVRVEAMGAPRPLDPIVLDEVVRIANEAIFNVWRHARASRLEIDLSYDASFVLRCADDGTGIDPDIAQAGGRAGHYGVSGMIERSRRLKGDLVVRQRREGGTEVILTVPGKIAYRSRGGVKLAPGRLWRALFGGFARPRALADARPE